MNDIDMAQGDLLPSLRRPLTMADDTPADLTGAIVELRFHKADGGVVLGGLCTILPAPDAHVVQYDWQDGDTDTPGIYRARFHATYPNAKPLSFPNDGYLRMVISAEIPALGELVPSP